MATQVKSEAPSSPPRTTLPSSTTQSRSTSRTSPSTISATPQSQSEPQAQSKPRNRKSSTADPSKRRCVSTACIACRRRKSKCDGNLPACAACASVYGTECIYDPNSDHRRKGVYKKDNADSLKTRNSTLQTLIQAILNSAEEDVPGLIRQIRTCESLDKVAEGIMRGERGEVVVGEEGEEEDGVEELDRRASNSPTFEAQLSSKMGTMKLHDGRLHFVGGTSNLMFGGFSEEVSEDDDNDSIMEFRRMDGDPIASWTTVTTDPDLITHLLNHYFTWHYTFFTILPKASFYKQFLQGKPPQGTRRKVEYCSPLLVNTMLSLGCHFTSNPGAREDPMDATTAGDHFFREARRLLYEGDELAKPSLATVQALALMSVREAGCGREAVGWVYSGMAFRMSCDLGLSFQTPSGLVLNRVETLTEEEEDARRVTFWGCFEIDKCWSNYLGRLPQFQLSDNVTVPRYDVFPSEDADTWSPYSDSGFSQAHAQPSRVRAVALQISTLCEISSDLIKHFYNPQSMDKAVGKQIELKRLSEIHTRLEDWRRNLPKELEPKEGILSSVLIMHMFFQLLYIHLFRPFLKYTQATSPLPSHVSPRKLCTQAAGMISKLMRLYKRSHGLRQIVNFAIYVVHSACTIHLLNLPEKTARRDIIHGVKHLEEMAEGWLVARRTLSVLSMQARKWKVDLPEEAAALLARTDAKFGTVGTESAGPSPNPFPDSPPPSMPAPHYMPPPAQSQAHHQQMNWQQAETDFPDPMGIFAMGNVPQNPHVMQHIVPNTFPPQPLHAGGQYTPQSQSQSQTPQYSLSPTQEFSPMRSSVTTPRANLKRTSTGTTISMGQQRVAAQMQPPQQPVQPQHPQRQNSLSQSQRPKAQPRAHTTTTGIPNLSTASTSTSSTSSQAPATANNKALRRFPSSSSLSFSTSDMFGGVEALLREGQEWWMKDQSHDLASGFGNWNLAQQAQQQQLQQQGSQQQGGGGGAAAGRPTSRQQAMQGMQGLQVHGQIGQKNTPSPQQAFAQQAQAQAQAQRQQQQGHQVQGGQQQVQQQQQQYHQMTRSGSLPEGDLMTGIQHSGVQGQSGYGFGDMGAVYNEDEWYQ